jgi:hypothetical protein
VLQFVFPLVLQQRKWLYVKCPPSPPRRPLPGRLGRRSRSRRRAASIPSFPSVAAGGSRRMKPRMADGGGGGHLPSRIGSGEAGHPTAPGRFPRSGSRRRDSSPLATTQGGGVVVGGGGGGASLRRGLEAWLWRWILSGRLGTMCVWPWRRSRSEVTSSTFGCLHRRSKGIWSVGVASRWLSGGGSSGGGDGGLAADVGEDATIVGGARGCRLPRWSDGGGVPRSIVSGGNLRSGGCYH